MFHTTYMLKSRPFLYLCVCIIYFTSFGAIAFEVNELSSYSAVAIKTMKPTDTIRPDKKYALQITGTKDLEKVLGKETKEFETLYVYIGDKQIEEYSTTKWYYYYQPSWHGRGRGKLNYKRNQITESGRPEDTLVVAKNVDDNLLFLIIDKGNPIRGEVFNALKIAELENTTDHSLWEKLWSDKSEKTLKPKLEEANSAIPKIPEKSWVRIYFTPGLDCENNIISEINDAKKIDIAVYSITNQNIVDAIINANERGAKIRIITDKLQSKGQHSLVDELADAGIPVTTNIKHKIEHNKFAIFDDKHVVSGSYNWTSNASQHNSENCLFFDQPQKEYSKRFEYLWGLYQK